MYEKQFATPEPVTLEVKIATGDIHVKTVDGDQSTVTLEGPEKLIEAMQVALAGSRLRITTRGRSLFGRFGHFDDVVRVHTRIPHRSNVEIATAASRAVLDGSFGRLDVKSASGDLVVTGQVEGDAEIKSVGGGARLPHIAGDLAVQTVSGDLVADQVDGSVVANSVSGDVRIGVVREGHVTLRSVSGNTELGVAPGTSIDVDAGSGSGELTSEVPLAAAPSGETGPTVVIRSKSASGDLRIFRAGVPAR